MTAETQQTEAQKLEASVGVLSEETVRAWNRNLLTVDERAMTDLRLRRARQHCQAAKSAASEDSAWAETRLQMAREIVGDVELGLATAWRKIDVLCTGETPFTSIEEAQR